MSIRFSRFVMGTLVFAAVVLMSGRGWAVYHQLGASKDEWGLKYDVEVKPAESDKLTVVFTVADEGRLKPFYSITLVAFSQPDPQGGRSYDLKAPIELKPTTGGRRAGQVQMRKEFADRAMIRILTLTVDGQRQTQGAACYDIPLKKYAPFAGSPQTPPTVAVPPASKVTK